LQKLFSGYKRWIGLFGILAIAFVVYANIEPSPAPVETITPPKPQIIAQPDPIGELIETLPETTSQPGSTLVEPVPNWQQFAIDSELNETTSAIAIVIDDLGNSTERLERLFDIKEPLTLSFLSYARQLPESTQKARARGYELLVHVPMEPLNGDVDPGMKAMLTSMDHATMRTSIDWHLSQFTDYVGFNNHMGSKFTADPAGMEIVIDAARERGLLFLDSRTTERTLGKALADQAGVPVIERDIFLDNVIEEEAILKQLEKAAAIARTRGTAVVIGHPHPETIQALKRWLAKLDDIEIVPLSALVKRSERNARLAQR
jgi:uncharacterized protein